MVYRMVFFYKCFANVEILSLVSQVVSSHQSRNAYLSDKHVTIRSMEVCWLCVCKYVCAWSVRVEEEAKEEGPPWSVPDPLLFFISLSLKSRPTSHIVVSTKRESRQPDHRTSNTGQGAQGLDLIAQNDANNNWNILGFRSTVYPCTSVDCRLIQYSYIKVLQRGLPICR